MTVDELRARAIEVLREHYPIAKRAVIELEVFTRSKSKKAIYELKDALDHLHSVFTEEDPESIRSHIEEIKTHLRRCTVEPMEYLAEKQFVRVDRVYRFLRWIPFPGNPALSSSLFAKLHQAQQLIVDGRLAKTETLKSYNYFKESFGITISLRSGIHPMRIALSVSGAAAAAAIVIGVLYSSVQGVARLVGGQAPTEASVSTGPASDATRKGADAN